MTLEPIVLAIASALRPAGLAATYALLSGPHPRRLLITYIAAGFLFSAGLGIVVVATFHGVYLSPPEALRGVPDLVVGAAALGFAAGIATGRGLKWAPDEPSAARRWAQRRLREPTVGVVIVAGIATRLPGLLYLLALNAILGEGHTRTSEIAQVLVFNTIWFSASIAAAGLLLVRGGTARAVATRVYGWVQPRERLIMFIVAAVVGIYLVTDGLRHLVG